jgi:MYXO-CTERM domain-containing protein
MGCAACSLGADEAQRSPVVLVAALAGLAAGILWSKRGARR